MIFLRIMSLIGLSLAVLFGIVWIKSKKRSISTLTIDENPIELANLPQLNKYIIQRMQSGVVVIDGNNHLLLMNHTARQLLGQLNTMHHVALQDISPTLSQQLEDWHKNPDQHIPPFRALNTGPDIIASFISCDDFKKGSVLIFLDDVSRTAQQAQQLKLASLGRFTASIAHEIRNPLGAISHAAQLLQEAPELTASDVRLVEIIQGHCKRVNEIINNILQISRRQQSEPTIINLKQWINECIANFQSANITKPDIILRAESDNINVCGDKDQLHQVLLNLFENGLRYSLKQTGVPTITVHVGVSRGSKDPYIDIVDKGPGILKQFSHRIFEPFFTTERMGVGLGLYVSKELCVANGARLELIPHTGEGCCFRINFHAIHPNTLSQSMTEKILPLSKSM